MSIIGENLKAQSGKIRMYTQLCTIGVIVLGIGITAYFFSWTYATTKASYVLKYTGILILCLGLLGQVFYNNTLEPKIRFGIAIAMGLILSATILTI